MLIDLIPQFWDAIAAADPVAGYRNYFEDHRPVLAAYWHNYVLDPDSPHADDIIRDVVTARRDDLRALLEQVDVRHIAEESLARCEDAFRADQPVDLYLMVGVGGATAGELTVAGRGIAFVCLEHFTGRPNPESHGMGLRPVFYCSISFLS